MEIVISLCSLRVSQQWYETLSFCFPFYRFLEKENAWKGERVREAQEKSISVCLLRVLGLCHCHSNVLLQDGNLRGEWEMSTNGQQREKWYNWIWLRLSVRTVQDLICSWNYFDSVTMRMTFCEACPVCRMRIAWDLQSRYQCGSRDGNVCLYVSQSTTIVQTELLAELLWKCIQTFMVTLLISVVFHFPLVPPSDWHLCFWYTVSYRKDCHEFWCRHERGFIPLP